MPALPDVQTPAVQKADNTAQQEHAEAAAVQAGATTDSEPGYEPQNTEASALAQGAGQWALWEVFTQAAQGAPHEHAGSLHAPDAEMALQNARDVYTRRGEAVSLWVVPARSITASSPSDAGPFFDPGDDKPYRHPQFYKVPRGVKNV